MIRFIGANPGLTILDGDERVAFASVWRADWSEHGPGRAIVLWHAGSTRVVATDASLGLWLAQDFTRHFPEVAGLAWPTPEVEVDDVLIELDLTTGLHATARDLTVQIGPPTDRRLFQTDAFDLGGIKHGLSTVFMPCETGSLRIGGAPIPGSAKAFLADAEVWTLNSAD
jgi:hypothetical protein